jgi:IrrE N-terminal-like domain
VDAGLPRLRANIAEEKEMTIDQQIQALLREVGTTDPRVALREKAREVFALYQATIGELEPPINMEAIASLRGIRRSDELPLFSPDAELASDSTGRAIMRVNPDRPETRQRFSMAHEVVHTFFPEYELKVQCRPDPRFRDADNPADRLETLCDAGAAELLFPLPCFLPHAAKVTDAAALVALAARYGASREATVRRFAETSERCVAAVFLTWKLAPTQKRDFNPNQMNLYGTNPVVEAWAARELRVEYSIPSTRFAAQSLYLPKDKSLDVEGPLRLATTGNCADGDADLDFGPARGRYRITALPVYTQPQERGPNGEWAIAAIIEPLEIRRPKSKRRTATYETGLF